MLKNNYNFKGLEIEGAIHKIARINDNRNNCSIVVYVYASEQALNNGQSIWNESFHVSGEDYVNYINSTENNNVYEKSYQYLTTLEEYKDSVRFDLVE